MSEMETASDRLIELGGLRIHLKESDDAVAVLHSLVRPLSNQEVAAILGVSERTVRRWKQMGRLPDRGKTRLQLADLLSALTPQSRGDDPCTGCVHRR